MNIRMEEEKIHNNHPNIDKISVDSLKDKVQVVMSKHINKRVDIESLQSLKKDVENVIIKETNIPQISVTPYVQSNGKIILEAENEITKKVITTVFDKNHKDSTAQNDMIDKMRRNES